jgi:hypothetical protein
MEKNLFVWFLTLNGKRSFDDDGAEFILTFGVGDVTVGKSGGFITAAEHDFFTWLELYIVADVPVFFGAGNFRHDDELLCLRLLSAKTIFLREMAL